MLVLLDIVLSIIRAIILLLFIFASTAQRNNNYLLYCMLFYPLLLSVPKINNNYCSTGYCFIIVPVYSSYFDWIITRISSFKSTFYFLVNRICICKYTAYIGLLVLERFHFLIRITTYRDMPICHRASIYMYLLMMYLIIYTEKITRLIQAQEHGWILELFNWDSIGISAGPIWQVIFWQQQCAAYGMRPIVERFPLFRELNFNVQYVTVNLFHPALFH